MLESISLFRGLSQDEANRLATGMRHCHLRSNALVCAQGEPGDHLYVIHSGRVKRYLAAEDGRQALLDHLGPGEHFGEIALITQGAHPASVVTLEETYLLSMTRKVLEQLLASHPVIAGNLALVLARRLATLTETFGSMALEDCFARVVRVLERCATQEGGRRMTPSMTQSDIAARIGCSREMVSRVLSALRAKGYLDTDGRRIVVLHPLPRRR